MYVMWRPEKYELLFRTHTLVPRGVLAFKRALQCIAQPSTSKFAFIIDLRRTMNHLRTISALSSPGLAEAIAANNSGYSHQ